VSVFSKMPKPLQGFTLSELLVSLAVLGVIAGIAVPAVWVSVKESQDRTLLCESIRIMNEATMAIANSPPALPAGSTTWDLYDLYLNSADDDRATTSFTLPGGTVLSSFNEPLVGGLSSGLTGIFVDANGSAPPNVIGKDRLVLTACFDPKGTCVAGQYTINTAIQESGTVGATPDSADGNSYTGNEAFFAQIMTTN
jgi:prepilin-type N-terminal cleavage/methylation domain-containing protein